MNQKGNEFAKFGVMGIGQIAFGVITMVMQRKVSSWLVQKEIEDSKPKPIRGFQRTPML